MESVGRRRVAAAHAAQLASLGTLVQSASSEPQLPQAGLRTFVFPGETR